MRRLSPYHYLSCIMRYNHSYLLYVSETHLLLSILTAISLVKLPIPEIIVTACNGFPLTSLMWSSNNGNIMLIWAPFPPPTKGPFTAKNQSTNQSIIKRFTRPCFCQFLHSRFLIFSTMTAENIMQWLKSERLYN